VYNTVFDVTTEDDWHLYMGGWRVPNTPPPDWLYELYHTDSITSPIAFNYGFYSNPVYDLLVSLTMTPFTARAAQFVFGFTIGTIPVWSQI
jgi:ABC-type oligopeptide transport system substrate-binding subunit